MSSNAKKQSKNTGMRWKGKTSNEEMESYSFNQLAFGAASE